jgi:hypothetical protein
MAETLNFREAVQRAGVSRQRLNEAIRSGRLPAQRGGGPGKLTTIQLEDLQAWCLSEGLALPVESNERLERLPAALIMDRLERLDELFAGMQRLEQLMGQVLERLERSERRDHFMPGPERTAEAQDVVPMVDSEEPLPNSGQDRRRRQTSKAAVLQRFRVMQAQGLSLQAMADRFNLEGVPTLSGKGRWQKGTIGKLLAQEG